MWAIWGDLWTCCCCHCSVIVTAHLVNKGGGCVSASGNIRWLASCSVVPVVWQLELGWFETEAVGLLRLSLLPALPFQSNLTKILTAAFDHAYCKLCRTFGVMCLRVAFLGQDSDCDLLLGVVGAWMSECSSQGGIEGAQRALTAVGAVHGRLVSLRALNTDSVCSFSNDSCLKDNLDRVPVSTPLFNASFLNVFRDNGVVLGSTRLRTKWCI